MPGRVILQASPLSRIYRCRSSSTCTAVNSVLNLRDKPSIRQDLRCWRPLSSFARSAIPPAPLTMVQCSHWHKKTTTYSKYWIIAAPISRRRLLRWLGRRKRARRMLRWIQMMRISRYSSVLHFTWIPIRAYGSGSPVQRKKWNTTYWYAWYIVRTKIEQKFALIRRADKNFEISCGQKSPDLEFLGSVIWREFTRSYQRTSIPLMVI